MKNKNDVDFYAIAAVSSLGIIALWKYIKLSSKIIETKQTIELVKFRPFTKIQDINKQKMSQTVLVQGAVSTLDGTALIKQVKNRKTYLGLNLKYKQPIYSNLPYNLKTEGYHLKLKQALAGSCRLQLHQGFCLRSIKSNNNLAIINLDKIDLSNALDLLQWKNTFRALSLSEHVLVLLSSLLANIFTILSFKKSQQKPLKGINIGYRQVDAGIQIGASLTVLGTVGITTSGNIFVQPSFIFKDVFLFLVQLTDYLNQLSLKKNLSVAVLMGSLGYLCWRFYKYGKKNRYF